jgi:hypothetical protein
MTEKRENSNLAKYNEEIAAMFTNHANFQAVIGLFTGC